MRATEGGEVEEGCEGEVLLGEEADRSVETIGRDRGRGGRGRSEVGGREAGRDGRRRGEGVALVEDDGLGSEGGGAATEG